MTTIAARISRLLEEDIIAGRMPPGERLEEPALADRFQVSRTPVREALRMLNSKGLVELVPRRGGVVADVGAGQIADMLEALCEFESLCCRVAAQRMSAMQRRQLELLHEQTVGKTDGGSPSEYLQLNSRFHQLIVQGTQNHTLISTVENLRLRLAPYRAAQAGVERRFEISHREHDNVLRAILDGRAEDAYLAMRSHTTRLTLHTIEVLEKQRANPGTAA